MRQNKSVSSWDDKGAFLYKGEMVTSSNMLDLIKGIIQTQPLPAKHVPKGWNSFMKAMAELNVPTSVVGNADNRECLDSLKIPNSSTQTPFHLPAVSHRASEKQRETSCPAWLSLQYTVAMYSHKKI